MADALLEISACSDDLVVFAKRPWDLDSEAVIATLDSNYCVPADIREAGFEYFIDAPIAREVLEVFGSREPFPEQIQKLLLFYAENDAYPDWI